MNKDTRKPRSGELSYKLFTQFSWFRPIFSIVEPKELLGV
jgi:hypothetical protein